MVLVAEKAGWKWDEEKILKALNKETGVRLRADSVTESLGERFTLLALVKAEEYAVTRAYLPEKYLNAGYFVVYITLNSGYSKLALEKPWKDRKGSGRLFTIDMITQTTGARTENTGEAAYLKSPLDLTECMYETERKTGEAAREKWPCLILLDSVSTMLIYNAQDVVEKFVHNLVGKANATGATLIVLCSDYDKREDATRTLGQFFDNVRKI